MLIQMAQDVANVKDVLTGEQPAANTPATTTLALIEQGLKVFTAIYKRIHRAMKEEFAKLYKLNRTYFDPQKYAAFQDAPPISMQDYAGDAVDIIPVSDPAMVSDMQRLARAEFLQRYVGAPGVNTMEIFKRQWEAAGIQNYEELIAPTPAGPPPEVLAKFAELEAKVNQMNASAELSKAQAIKTIEEAAQLGPAAQLEAIRLWVDSFSAHNDAAQGAMQPGGEGQPAKQGQVKPPLLPMPGTPPAGISTPMSNNAGVPPARAMGGPVTAGQPYLVGEKGPEVVVPGQSGTVLPNGFVPPNTYDEALIRMQGNSKRSEGVAEDGSIPGFQGNLDPSAAGDNWTTIGVAQDGLNLTYVIPTMPGESGDAAVERFKKTKQHYGAFETDQAGEDFMRSRTRRK